MRKSNEQKLYERTVKSLPHLNDESLDALIRLSRQLLTARRMVREKQVINLGQAQTPTQGAMSD